MDFTSPTRRTFLKAASLAAGTATFGGLTPTRVLGANDKINFAVIGVGGMGTGHLRNLVTNAAEWNINVVAVCDVYQRRLTRASTYCAENDIKVDEYLDYRKLLERNDIDAVLIATPDHWHSTIAIEAMEAGKHVYLEKPMTLTVEQAIEVRNAVRRLGKKLQVGPQYTSWGQTWDAKRAIADGSVGKVTWAHGSYNRNVRDGAFNRWFKIDESAGPKFPGEDYIDWDMWLGHKWGLAPRIPWNPEHFFRFRKYFQYNGGVATDLLYHYLSPLLLAIAGENGQYPKRVTANGGLYILKDGRDIPDVFLMSVDYPDEFTIFLESVLTNNTQLPTRIYGQYGTIEFTGDAQFTSNGDFKQEFRDRHNGYDEVKIAAKNAGGSHTDMEKNLIDAIRTDKPLYCNAELGCAVMVAIKMGVESYRQNKILLWDNDKEQVIG